MNPSPAPATRLATRLISLARRVIAQPAVQLVGVALLWFVIGVALLAVTFSIVYWLTGASPAGRLVLVLAILAAWAAWQARRRIARDSPEQVVRIDRAIVLSSFTVYASIAVCWLLIGLVPALAAAVPSFADVLRTWGRGTNTFADLSLQAARAARNSSSGAQVTLDYVFSVINVVLATFLVVKVRGNRTANLLAFGMVGTAVAFNLQSHATLTVLGGHLGGFTEFWHNFGAHVLAGVAYVFALILFPDGQADRTRGPHLLALAAVFGMISFIAIEDHTSALVLLFGVLVPAAALVAQSRRFREAQTPDLRRLHRLIRGAMGVSLATALGILLVTSILNSRNDEFTESTREYELVAPEAGTYVFYCDPHIDDMKGTLVVREATGPTDVNPVIAITARGGRFDRSEVEMVANRTAVIRFTNQDGTAHNVSIYRDADRRDAVFVGQLFSGQDLATFTFRVFRFVFVVIPIALFVAILRFHLWDVDRLINRAMVYSALTGILGLTYAIGALILGLLPRRVFNQSELVAVWILAAAMLFRPARRRLQSSIDRRFYREKLDTVQALETFSTHVRDQIDLDQLAHELVEVVSSTMHPTQVSLWIRDGQNTPTSDVSDTPTVTP